MVLLLRANAAAVHAHPAPPHTRALLVFRHSWDFLPVFWFSANETGPETAAEQALISKYSAAVLSWELQTQSQSPQHPPWRCVHSERDPRSSLRHATVLPQD